MKKFFAITLSFFIFAAALNAEEIFRIHVGKNQESSRESSKENSNSDLQRRVWELERAMFQLQQKVYHLDETKNEAKPDSWVCTFEAMGELYTGTGGSKAVATSKALEACKNAHKGDGFFCKSVKCEQ